MGSSVSLDRKIARRFSSERRATGDLEGRLRSSTEFDQKERLNWMCMSSEVEADDGPPQADLAFPKIHSGALPLHDFSVQWCLWWHSRVTRFSGTSDIKRGTRSPLCSGGCCTCARHRTGSPAATLSALAWDYFFIRLCTHSRSVAWRIS